VKKNKVMSTSVTKPVAARIPFDNYYQLHSLAEFEGMKMSDYLNLIISQHLADKSTLIKSIKEGKNSKDLKPLILQMQKTLDALNKAKS
jgi:hypothetical protein